MELRICIIVIQLPQDRKAFAYLCKQIGTTNKSSHKARKTYVTALIDANVNVNQVRSMVGHSSEKTTYASYCYTRETPEENKKLIEKALSQLVNTDDSAFFMHE